jgi:hypothetical protein
MSYRQLKNFYELWAIDSSRLSFSEMLDLVKTHPRKGGYNQAKVKEEIGCEDLNSLLKDILYSNEVLSQNATFHLYERAYHVFGEAERVY